MPLSRSEAGRHPVALPLVALHAVSLLSSLLAIYLLDLTLSDPSPVTRVPLVVGLVSGAQAVASALSYCLLRKRSHVSKDREKDKDGKRRKSGHTIDTKGHLMAPLAVLKDLKEGAISVVVASVVFHLVIVLLGAPVFEDFEWTFALSWVLVVLTVVPLVVIQPFPPCSSKGNKPGPPSNVLDRILVSSPFQMDDPIENFLVTNAYLVLGGAWFGAFPIKLDWGQAWQEFPVTCLVGSLLVNGSSHFVHLLIIGYKFLFRTK